MIPQQTPRATVTARRRNASRARGHGVMRFTLIIDILPAVDGSAKFLVRRTLSSSAYPQVSVASWPACGTVFQLDFKSPDYTLGSNIGTGTDRSTALKFYLEQGAGLDTLVLPAFIAGRRPGRRYIEIGCGFGFGLDFAHRALGFEARGIDPSPI